MPDKENGDQAPPDLKSQAGRVIGSMELFQGKKLVLIHHNDGWYKLMITKQNKLILMK